ncbi:hypothetical protein ACSSV1_005888 [Labrenzia sp. MBR-25]|jgi:hypothetical protein
MRYSIIADTSQTFQDADRSGERKKAADSEGQIDKVEHVPIPVVEGRLGMWSLEA